MKFILLNCVLFIFVSCNNNQLHIKNYKKGEMLASMRLNQIGVKSFLLDDETAPKPYYIQIVNDSLMGAQITFINNYNNSIYFYNYDNQKFIKKITFDKNGPNGVQKPMGYHIKNRDSIYIFSQLQEVLLVNSKGNVLNKISLNGGHNIQEKDNSWAYIYPEFYVETVTPFIESSDELLLTGQFGTSLPVSIIDSFKFTARIGFGLNEISYSHTYPRSLFGNNVNWGEGLFEEVFPQLHPDGDKMIYSFPISHDLFITDMSTNEYEDVYAGSNFATTISSINKKPGHASVELIKSTFVRQDMYAAIIYDKFRKVYYRFIRRALPNAPKSTSWKEKNIAVIIMDENFNYLGETNLGTERKWHWQNSFVTKEGLNIESTDENNIEEVNLTLKIFVPKKI